jgi:hypothetical protein
MTRKYHTMSIEDREMFAYISSYEKQQERLRNHLAQPENRIRYCYEFMKDFIDPEMKQHAFERSLEYIAQAENDGSDY